MHTESPRALPSHQLRVIHSSRTTEQDSFQHIKPRLRRAGRPVVACKLPFQLFARLNCEFQKVRCLRLRYLEVLLDCHLLDFMSSRAHTSTMFDLFSTCFCNLSTNCCVSLLRSSSTKKWSRRITYLPHRLSSSNRNSALLPTKALLAVSRSLIYQDPQKVYANPFQLESRIFQVASQSAVRNQ